MPMVSTLNQVLRPRCEKAIRLSRCLQEGLENRNNHYEEAIAGGKALTAVINSGLRNPVRVFFLADVENQRETEAITAEVVESVLMSSPACRTTTCLKAPGFFWQEDQTDGRNLTKKRENVGYEVVYTEEQVI